ncbi:MAG: cytidine deaminase [Romboutsia sp.]
MDSLNIQKFMYEIATEFITKRFPKGWGGVAVIRTEKGNLFTSIALDNANGSTQLCIEVGAMCEAHKYNEKVTHCICVVRENEDKPFTVLTPCGICQERLRYWGTDVLVGVTTKDNTLKFITLEELQPYHWTNAYSFEELDHFHL